MYNFIFSFHYTLAYNGVFGYILDMLETLDVLGMYSMHRGIRISAFKMFNFENGVIPNDIGFESLLPES